jgi:hypothetical protein
MADGAPVGVDASLQISNDGTAPGGYLRGTFYDLTYTYTATTADDGKAMGIQILGSGNWTHATIDNVRLDASVPEPMSAGVIFAGLGFGALRRRRVESR